MLTIVLVPVYACFGEDNRATNSHRVITIIFIDNIIKVMDVSTTVQHILIVSSPLSSSPTSSLLWK